MSPFHLSKKRLALSVSTVAFLAIMLIGETASAVDIRCWTKPACEKARMESGVPSKEAAAGFYDGPDAKAACGESVRIGSTNHPAGFCLPAGKTVTQISFGGRTSFNHIGDFIQFMYKYGFQIAIVLATSVVIFAGFIWVQSRGNSEGIKSAQDKIYKAVMGLILYGISYTILNMLSPSFVNFRLPQVWMINPIHLTSQFCDQVVSSTPLAMLASNDEARLMTNAEKKKKYTEIETDEESRGFTITPQRADCGNTYLLARGNGTTCEGLTCSGEGKTCYQRVGNPRETCEWANIGGRIYTSNIDANAGSTFFGAWAWKWANEPLVYYVCTDGDYGNVGGSKNDPDSDAPDEAKKTQQYHIRSLTQTHIDEAIKGCGSREKLKGFVLSLDMNEAGEITADERHFIGILRQNHLGIDLGDKANLDADCLLKKAPADVFITPDELKKGVRLDIDANLIEDIDDESDRIRAYAQFDYKTCI